MRCKRFWKKFISLSLEIDLQWERNFKKQGGDRVNKLNSKYDNKYTKVSVGSSDVNTINDNFSQSENNVARLKCVCISLKGNKLDQDENHFESPQKKIY